jgi:hypothetical protein
MISDYEKKRLRKRERPLPVTNPPKDPSGSQAMRDEAVRKRGTRGAKLARIFAKPEQLSVEDNDIVVNPRGETTIQRAEREAKEARKAADEAKRRAG